MTDPTRSDDLELPAALRRRLDAIDAELPRTPRWRPAAPGRPGLHVVRASVHSVASPRARRRAGLERLVAAAAAVAILGGGYLLGRGVDEPGSIAIPSASSFVAIVTPRPSVAPSAVGSADPNNPTTKPTPQVNPAGIETLRGADDAATLIARRHGWACRLHRQVAVFDELGMVDKLIDTRTVRDGWIYTPSKVRLRIGGSQAEAAAAFKATLIANGAAGHPWIVIDAADGPVAYTLLAERTPMGRLTWRLGDSEVPVACDISSTKAILGRGFAGVGVDPARVVDVWIVRLPRAGALATYPS